MSVESWDPNAPKESEHYSLDQDLLLKIIETRQSDKELPTKQYFNTDELQSHSAMMKLDREQWLFAIKGFSEAQLLNLVEFLTLVEKQNSSWQAGELSPVIYIVKFMRQNKMPLNRDMLLWIKSNSDNKFLPNGPL